MDAPRKKADLDQPPRHKPATPNEILRVPDWTPSVDISETDKAYLIKAEIPDVTKEDIKVTAENGVLTIQGERKMEKEEKRKRVHRIERSYGSFVPSFRIPAGVDESKAIAVSQWARGCLGCKVRIS